MPSPHAVTPAITPTPSPHAVTPRHHPTPSPHALTPSPHAITPRRHPTPSPHADAIPQRHTPALTPRRHPHAPRRHRTNSRKRIRALKKAPALQIGTPHSKGKPKEPSRRGRTISATKPVIFSPDQIMAQRGLAIRGCNRWISLRDSNEGQEPDPRQRDAWDKGRGREAFFRARAPSGPPSSDVHATLREDTDLSGGSAAVR
nr:proline-rich receptor-like protein kinase PERK2 [Penaeus vannamei]